MNNSAKCGTETSRDQNEGESPSRCGAWALRGRAGSGQEAELGDLAPEPHTSGAVMVAVVLGAFLMCQEML